MEEHTAPEIIAAHAAQLPTRLFFYVPLVNNYNQQSYSPGKRTQRNYLLFGQNKHHALPKTHTKKICFSY
jgi:hypothetical protein